MKLNDIAELYGATARVWQTQSEPSKLLAWQDFMKTLGHRYYAARVGALLGELFEELKMESLEFKLTRSMSDASAKWAVKHNLELNEHGKFSMPEFKLRYQKSQAYASHMMYSINPSIGLYLKYKDRDFNQHIEKKVLDEAIKAKDGFLVFKLAFPEISERLEFKEIPSEFKVAEDKLI
jgi:hypothetical protein